MGVESILIIIIISVVIIIINKIAIKGTDKTKLAYISTMLIGIGNTNLIMYIAEIMGEDTSAIFLIISYILILSGITQAIEVVKSKSEPY